MANELQRVPITINTMMSVSGLLGEMSLFLDKDLTHDKNAEYGDAWQAEGPLLAASRMKDKIARVALVVEHRTSKDWATGIEEDQGTKRYVTARTTAEGFQDILEMIQYGKMIMLYWGWNDLGLAGTEVASVTLLYEKLKLELDAIRERMNADAARRELEQGQGEDSPRNQEVYQEE